MATILIDGNNVGMAAHFANASLTNSNGDDTGAIFGFIRMVRPMIEEVMVDYIYEPVKVMVAWDSSPSWREKVLSTYKETRKKERDPEMELMLERYFKQLPRLRQLLSYIGVSQIRADNQEADDIAGFLTQRPVNWILMSGDKDWIQLVRPNVKVWQPSKAQYVTVDNFVEVTKAMIDNKSGDCCADPDQFVKMLAIAGDTGDDVPGVKGVGYAKAVQYLQGKMNKGKTLEKIEAWMKDPNGYQRSLELVDLRSRQIDHSTIRLTPGQYDKTSAYALMAELNFSSILTDFDKWCEPYRLVA